MSKEDKDEEKKAPKAEKQKEKGKEKEDAPQNEAKKSDGFEMEVLREKLKKAQEQLKEYEEKLKASEDKVKESDDKYLRMLAEYDNFRRRSQKERENIFADVRGDTVKKILPVYDNLARAAAQEPTEEAREGMEAVLNQFQTILEGLGVKAIDAVGKKFDPALHEALLHIEDEKYGEGEIVQEMEKGFMLGDKVIRFAKVQVAN